jgi:membrane protein YdbS with pleckstrin-like domain
LKGEPEERLDSRAIRLWRLTAALGMTPLVIGGGVAMQVLLKLDQTPAWIALLPLLLAILLGIVTIGVVPPLRWRMWRYEIRPDEIDLQRGILWIERTLVPLARIQHVDTRQGPLQRRFGLSTVVFYTAAGPNQIPELSTPIAAEVRDRIAVLTGEQDEL